MDWLSFSPSMTFLSYKSFLLDTRPFFPWSLLLVPRVTDHFFWKAFLAARQYWLCLSTPIPCASLTQFLVPPPQWSVAVSLFMA